MFSTDFMWESLLISGRTATYSFLGESEGMVMKVLTVSTASAVLKMFRNERASTARSL